MPRIRTIKPEFPQSESMGRVSRDARLLFIMLWTIADDFGKARGNSRMLASLLFPYDSDAGSLIEGWLSELEREGCVVRYMGDDDGAAYVKVTRWSDHQRIDKPTKSKIPDPTFADFARIRESSRGLQEDSQKLLVGPGRDREEDLDREEDPDRVATRPKNLPAQPVVAVDPKDRRFPDFPCVAGRKCGPDYWTATGEFLERMAEAFPSVNIEREAKKAHAWVLANLDRRKTAGGMEDFMRRWMSKEQDKSDRRGTSQMTFAQQRVENTQRAIEDFANE